jgi:folate-binding protein YgfZ
MNKITKLQNRAIIEIAGEDRKKFLQGLITNDVNKSSTENLLYSAMLNASGRFLYDFFIQEKDEKLLIECEAIRADEIVKKLNFYKLRSQVKISKNENLFVAQSFENIGFADPRCKNLGQRIYLQNSAEKNFQIEENFKYHAMRIANKIPEGELDLFYEKSIILEFGFDELNAIDYKKGCYVGQELTARTHYKGEIRKKLFHVEIHDSFGDEKISKGLEITCGTESAGIILSSVFYGSKCHALALINISQDFHTKENLRAFDKKISVIS